MLYTNFFWIDSICKYFYVFLIALRTLRSAIYMLVYKIPYHRAPRIAYWLPLGRVRRASKGILHTICYNILLLARTRPLGQAHARR